MPRHLHTMIARTTWRRDEDTVTLHSMIFELELELVPELEPVPELGLEPELVPGPEPELGLGLEPEPGLGLEPELVGNERVARHA